MHDVYKVNTDNVEIGQEFLDKVYSLLKKAATCIANAKSSLDNDISVSGFDSVSSGINNSLTGNKKIMNECEEYVSIATSKVQEIDSKATELINDLVNSVFPGAPVDNTQLNNNNNNTSSKPTNGDDTISDEEYNKLMLLFSFNNGTEMEEEDIRSMIENNDYLNQDDKDYMNKQLDKGNIRAAMQYLVIKNTEQEVELAQKEKKEIQDRLAAIASAGDPTRGFKPAQNTEEVAALNKRLAEIKEMERTLNKYKLSGKEWEYDCYFKLIGTEKFDSLTIPSEFYSAATAYYEKQNSSAFVEPTELMILVTHDSSNESFVNWLKSDECNLANKDKLLEFYNSNVKGQDYSSLLYDVDPYGRASAYIAYGIGSNGYSLSTDEQRVLAYLFLTEGDDAVTQFLDDFKDTMNSRGGAEDAVSVMLDIIEASKNGVGAGESFWEGLKIGTDAWFSRIAEIGDKRGVMTKEEYQIQYLNSFLTGLSYLSQVNVNDLDNLGIDNKLKQEIIDSINNGENVTYLDIAKKTGQITDTAYDELKELANNPDIDAFLKSNSGEGLFGISHMDWLNHSLNAGIATGNMLPSIVLSAATSGILSGTTLGSTVMFNGKTVVDVFSKLAGLGAMGAYSYSSNKSEAIRNGRDYGEAVLYSLLSAAGESATEYLIGGIPFVSKGADWLELSATDSMVAKITKTLLGWTAINPLMEIAQEELQDVVWDPLMEIVTYGETDYKFNIEQFVKTAITTYLSTFVMQGVTVTLPTSINLVKQSTTLITVNLNGQDYQLSYSDVLACMNEDGQSLSQEKLAAKIQEKVNVENAISDMTNTQQSSTNESFFNRVKNRIGDWIMQGVPLDQGSDGGVDAATGEVIKGAVDTLENAMDTVNKIKEQIIAKSVDEQLDILLNTTIDEFSKVEYSEEEMNALSLKIDSLKEESTPFKNKVLDTLKAFYTEQMQRGNANIEMISKGVIELFEKGLVIKESDRSNAAGMTLYLTAKAMSAPLTLSHELMHLLHAQLDTASVNEVQLRDDGKLQAYPSKYNSTGTVATFNKESGCYELNGYNYTKIVEMAREMLRDPSNIFWKMQEKYTDTIYDLAIEKAKSKVGARYDGIVESFKNETKSMIIEKGIKNMLESYGLSNLYTGDDMEISADLLQKITERRLVRMGETNNTDILSTVKAFSAFNQLCDIVDAISAGEFRDELLGGHTMANPNYYEGDLHGTDLVEDGTQYDAKRGIANQVREVLAQFEVFLSYSPEAIDLLRIMVGDDYVDMIMSEVSKIHGVEANTEKLGDVVVNHGTSTDITNGTIEEQVAAFNNLESQVAENEKVVYSETQINAITEKLNSYKGGSADSRIIDQLINLYSQQMKNGNPHIASVIESTFALLDSNIKLEVIPEGSKQGSGFSNMDKTVYIAPADINNPITITHEIMHGKHWLLDQLKLFILNKNKYNPNGMKMLATVGNSPVFQEETGNYEFNGYNYTDVVLNARELLNNKNNVFWKLLTEYNSELEVKAKQLMEEDLSKQGVTYEEALQQKMNKIKNDVSEAITNTIKLNMKKYGLTYEEGIEKAVPKIENMINQKGLKTVMEEYGLSDSYEEGMTADSELKSALSKAYLENFYGAALIKDYMEKNDFTEMYQEGMQLTDDVLRKMAELYLKTEYSAKANEESTFVKMLDIADSVSGGTYRDSGTIDYGHGEAYYGTDLTTFNNSGGVTYQVAEAVAQFESILATSPGALPMLYDIFGKDYCDMIMSEVNRIHGNAVNTQPTN